MAIDAPTMLLLSLVIGMIASTFLFCEWRAIRDPALALWGAGFATVAAGCALAPLRQSVSPVLGLWFANGLLLVAHLLFLRGNAAFTGQRASTFWWVTLPPWGLMLLVPIDAAHGPLFGFVNAALVATLALGTARLTLSARVEDDSTRRLGLVSLVHGAFQALKAVLAPVPGGFVNILAFKGPLVGLSLLEGIVVEIVLAMLMLAAVRRRRENQIAVLAARDPLTGLLNRRGFRDHMAALLPVGTTRSIGALLLIDLDHFKAVNDTAGHSAGDRLLMALAEVLVARMPANALLARLGGDEFVVVVPDLEAVDLGTTAQSLRHGFAAAGEAFLPRTLVASLSIGAVLLRVGDDLDTLMERADAALYEAKRGGRNRLAIDGAPPLRPAIMARRPVRRAASGG